MKKLLMVALISAVGVAHADSRWVETTDTLDRSIGSRTWIDVNWTQHTKNPNIRIYNYYGNYQDLEISQGVFEIDCKLKIQNVYVIQHTNKKTGIITKKENTGWQSFNLLKDQFEPYRLICG